jgi:hypothetical protein
MMVKFRNVLNNLTFSHFDIEFLVDHLLQIVLRDLAPGGGGTEWLARGDTKRGGGHVFSVYMLKESLHDANGGQSLPKLIIEFEFQFLNFVVCSIFYSFAALNFDIKLVIIVKD